MRIRDDEDQLNGGINKERERRKETLTDREREREKKERGIFFMMGFDSRLLDF